MSLAALLLVLAAATVHALRNRTLHAAGDCAPALAVANLLALAGRQTGQGNAVAFALLTGAAIAGYGVIDARAVRRAAPPAYLGAVLLLTGGLLAGGLRGDMTRLRAALGPGARVAVGSAAA